MTATLRHSLRVWRALLLQSASMALIYRGQAAIWLIGGFIPLAVMLVWMELAKAGALGGYDQADFALYFLGVYLVLQLKPMWCIQLLDRSIRRGELSPLLLRPMPTVWQHAAEHLGEHLVRAPVVISVFTLGLWLTGVAGRIEATNLLLFLPALAAAWLIVFNLYYALGLLAFWLEGVMAFDPLVWALYALLGGAMVPIDLFPSGLQGLVRCLPFASALDFPVQLLLGRLDAAEMLRGFALQALWVLLILAARRGLWRAGLKRFAAAGA